MSLKIVQTEDFKNMLIEEGVWESIITSMEERKEKSQFTGDVEYDVIRFEFTITDEGDMYERKAFRSVRPNIGEKSNLKKICRAVMGRDFTPEELATVDELDDLRVFLLNKPVQIIVKQKTSARGNKYYHISDWVKSKKLKVEAVPQPDDFEQEMDSIKDKGKENLSDDELNKIAKEIDRETEQEQPSASVAKATPIKK